MTDKGEPKSADFEAQESLLEFTRTAEIILGGTLFVSAVPHPQVIRDFYKSELLKRIPEQSTFQPIEVVFITTLLVRFSACRELIRNVASIWGGTIEEVVQFEAQLDESLTNGALKKFVTPNHRGVFYIASENKSELLSILIEKEIGSEK